MAHDQEPQLGAESEEEEPVLLLRVVRAVLQPAILVGKVCFPLSGSPSMRQRPLICTQALYLFFVAWALFPLP